MGTKAQEWTADQARRVELTTEALSWIDDELRGKTEGYVSRDDWTQKFEPFLGPLFTFLSTYPKRYAISGDSSRYRVSAARRYATQWHQAYGIAGSPTQDDQADVDSRGTPDVPAVGRRHPVGRGNPKPCKFWPLGTCRFGKACRYAHEDEDRKGIYWPIGAGRAHPYR